jgi:hypothetical protein
VYGASPRTWLMVALAAGLLLRLGFALAQDGMYCPDEIFQYLEPAWRRLHGFGALSWEYEWGARNWILPAFYGALMQIGEAFGLRGWALHRFLSIHDALFSALIIPAGFRLGRALGDGDERLAVLVGCALAIFPLFAHLAPHTLSDNHGLLLVTWAFALWLESERAGTRRAHWVGLLLAAAVIMRYELILFVPIVVLGQAIGSRRRELIPLGLGLGAGACVLGLVDALTWGAPFHSLVALARANRGGGAEFGAAATTYYLEKSMLERVGVGVVILAAAMPFRLRRDWRVVAGWALPLVALSALPHKLDRYLLPIWPLFLAAGLAGLLALRDRFAGSLGERRANLALLVTLALVWGAAFRATLRQPMRLSAGIFRAQSVVGRRADATGLLVDGEAFFSKDGGEPWLDGESRPFWHGGQVLTGRGIPISLFRWDLLPHRLYNYIVIGDGATAARLASTGLVEVVGRYEGGVTLFGRRP